MGVTELPNNCEIDDDRGERTKAVKITPSEGYQLKSLNFWVHLSTYAAENMLES